MPKISKLTIKPQCIPLYFTVATFLLALIYVYLRGQDRNWDLLNYHFYTGYALLYGRNLQDIAAANLQSFFNPIVNALAYLSLKYLPFPFSGWLLAAIQLLSIPATVLVAREVGKGMGFTKVTLSEVLALALCIIAPLWWSELGTTFFSSTTTPLILFGFYLLLRSDSSKSTLRYSLIAPGFLFGLACGLKLTNAPFAVAATISLLYLLYNKGLWHLFTRLLQFTMGGIIGFAVTAWWNWYLFDAWGSPLFPLYNSVFMSPFYDLTNWRDMRWHFSTFSELIMFVVQAFTGSSKTSEIQFADARLLVIFLLLPSVLLCKPFISFGRQVIAFLLFTLSGFALWCEMLAYQRYLIPIELLLGLVVWIFVLRIVEQQRVRIIVMLFLTCLSFIMLKVPDWGHAKVKMGASNPFSIDIPEKLYNTSARYLMIGVPISYIIPSLHRDSVFYGNGFSKQIDERIFNQLRQPSPMPLRFIARDSDEQKFMNLLKSYDGELGLNNLNCEYFKTGVGRYKMCEVTSN